MARISTLILFFSLLCLLVTSSLANPLGIDDLELPDLDKRQDNNSTSTPSDISSSTTTSTTSSIPSSTSSSSSRSTPTSSTPTPSPPPPVTSDTPAPSSTTPRPPVQTSDDPVPSTTREADTTFTATPTTRVVVTTIYTTLSGNGGVSSYVTSSTTVETPSGTAINQTPGGDNNDDSGGLTAPTRNTIIGVVVGVGGALLFGGLAIVAWRLRRKRVNPVDEDDLMRRGGSPLAAGREIATASPEQSPFKATLDQYHKPPGVVNASSNF